MAEDSARKVLHRGRWLELVEEDGWEFVDRPNISGIVVVLAVTDERSIILVEQFRKPVGRSVLELPAGLAGDTSDDPTETLADAAKRELLEETGYAATEMEFLTLGPPSPGLCTEVLTFFRATGLQRASEGGGVDGENIRVHEVPLDGIDDWLEEMARQGARGAALFYPGLYFARSWTR